MRVTRRTTCSCSPRLIMGGFQQKTASPRVWKPLALKEEGLVKDHVVVSLDPVWSLGRWRLGSGPAARLGAPLYGGDPIPCFIAS
jgi:hypothetical protein